MPRNFFRRVEVVYPIEDPSIRDRLVHEILGACLRDNVKARELGSDGVYRRVAPGEAEPVNSQQFFLNLAAAQAESAPGLPSPLPVRPPASITG
jgi:polyphosphate kinase